MNRRSFISSLAPLAAYARPADGGFFKVRRMLDRWWLVQPNGRLFFSIGMNHIDSATLRYAENGRLWAERYGNSEEAWIRNKVARDLSSWGFNSVGWVQDVVIRSPTIHRHSRNWTLEQYRWLGMPYCHMLPFSEIHQWERETRHPDFFSKDFEQWCDYVARDQCQRMAGEPNLIGYFYSDCPMWVHTQFAHLKQPLFDARKLASAVGRDELKAMAARYYQVTHDAVRRYDPNHLILGDRWEARAALPDEVVLAASTFVDVLSFQYFAGAADIRRAFTRFHELTGKPVLLGDNVPRFRGKGPAPAGWFSDEYASTMETLREMKCCVGWHLCGAYLANRVRAHGLLAEDEAPVLEVIAPATKINNETRSWLEKMNRQAEAEAH